MAVVASDVCPGRGSKYPVEFLKGWNGTLVCDDYKGKAWLFAGSELAGQRAAMVMSLVQPARLNGHDPWAHLKDVQQRLPTHPNNRINELLPHQWRLPTPRSRRR